MAEDRAERRLTTILAADVVGYSRLMAADEAGTLAQLKTHRKELIEPKTAKYHGRVVKLMGDGTLMEFGSVVDAVNFAVHLQRAMAGRNVDVPEDRRIAYRMGINIGDIIVEGEDIYGDGVNVAARLEGLAEAGGICISGSVYDQVRDRLDFAFEDMGEQEVKNIDRPVRVWRWSEVAKSGSTVTASEPLPLPDKPSIAVLPFTNMSGDPEQEYFSDGITEDIITELSRFRSLFVIARNSSFHYKGQSPKMQEVGRELGVQYVVEGSVRKAGNRVRITAQLVEAEAGHHVWAERYDREIEDIFAVQDEVAQTIVSTVAGRLEDARVERARRRPTENLAAYDWLLRGIHHIHRYTKADYAAARPMINKAIEIDPQFARAHAALGLIDVFEQMWRVADENALDRALASAQKAMSLDDDDTWAYAVFANVYVQRGRQDEAVNFMEKAYRLNPNDPATLAAKALMLEWVGRHDEAIETIETGMRLDPFHPDWMLEISAMALYSLRRYEEAIDAFRRIKEPPYWIPSYIAACAAQLERTDEVRREVAAFHDAVERETTADNPQPGIAILDFMSYKKHEDRDHWLDGLRKAGFEV